MGVAARLLHQRIWKFGVTPVGLLHAGVNLAQIIRVTLDNMSQSIRNF